MVSLRFCWYADGYRAVSGCVYGEAGQVSGPGLDRCAQVVAALRVDLPRGREAFTRQVDSAVAAALLRCESSLACFYEVSAPEARAFVPVWPMRGMPETTLVRFAWLLCLRSRSWWTFYCVVPLCSGGWDSPLGHGYGDLRRMVALTSGGRAGLRRSRG